MGTTANENASTSIKKVNLASDDKRNGNGVRGDANGYINGIKVDVDGYFNAAALLNKVTAAIAAGGTVRVNGALTVKAVDTTTLDALSGSVAAGGLAAGGAVLITHIQGTTESYVGGTVILSNAAPVNISAIQEITATNYKALTGTAGVIGGLGAAVAWLDVTGTNSAYTMLGSSLSGFETLTIQAVQKINVSPEANGASAGAVGIGVATAKLIVSGKNEILLHGNLNGAAINAWAEQTINTNVRTIAAAGGYFIAGAAAIALAEIKGTNQVTSDANLTLTGQADIGAFTYLKANVAAYGLSIAVGGSLGLPVATLTVSPKIYAYITGGTSSVGSLLLRAYYNVNGSEAHMRDNNVSVTVKAGSAAGLTANAVNYAYLNMTGENKALITGGSLTTKGGDINVMAKSFLKTSGEGSGTAIAGGASIGAVIVYLTENFTTEAGITAGTVSGRNITVRADSITETTLTAQATGGGILLAGTGADAKADITSKVKAYLKGTITATGNINVTAQKLLSVNATGRSASYGGGIGVGVVKVTLVINPTVLAQTAGTISAGGAVKVLALYNKNENLTSTGHQIIVSATGGAGSLLAAATGVEVSVTHSGSVKVNGEGNTSVSAGTITGNTGAALASNADKTTTHNITYIAASHTNIKVTAGGNNFAGGVAIGAVVGTIKDTMQTQALVRGTMSAEEDILTQAMHSSNISADIKGTSGGLLAAGVAQALTVDTETTTEANAGGIIRAGYDFGVLASTAETINAKVSGWAVAGFASGGISRLTFNLKSHVYGRVGEASVVNAGRNITVNAINAVDKTGISQSSAAAFGGAGSDAEEQTTEVYNTLVDIGVNSNLRATLISGYDMDIRAQSAHKNYGYATNIAGAVIAIGVAKVTQSVADTVVVFLFEPVLTSLKGNLSIHADANVNTRFLKAMGGAGGLYNGNSVKAQATLAQIAQIKFYDMSEYGDYADLRTQGGDITVQTTTTSIADVQAQIQFSVSGLNTLTTESYNTMNIISEVLLGNATHMNSAANIYINALIREIYANAWTYSKTTAVVNTQSRPLAEVTVIGNARITGNNANLTAARTLQILADASEGTKLHIRAYAYGETAGGTGSIISIARNNTKLYGTITLTGDASVFRARDIIIEASVPAENSVEYSKQAVYKAYTVTEFIKQTIEGTKSVIETVTEKICKWLPWPFNKIIKWISKTIVKVISWFEEIIVEKVLQSETDARNEGSYISGNSVELHGDIYYGSNAPVSIVVGTDGRVNDSNVKYRIEGNNLIIESYNSKAMGSLTLNSYRGTISGAVRVHTLSMITDMTITNNSNYDLIIKELNLQANEDPDSCNYNIYCQDNSNFTMEDVMDVVASSAPIFRVYTNSGKNVTYDGSFTYYTAEMLFQFNGVAGNVFFGSNGHLGINKLTIINALNVGSIVSPVRADMYIVNKGTDQWANPVVDIQANGNVYAAFTVKKYVEVADEAAKKALLDANEAIKNLLINRVSAGGNVYVTMNPAILVIGMLTSENTPSEHEYTVNELQAERIDGDVEIVVNQDIIPGIEHLVYVREVEGNLVYYKDVEGTEVYDDSYTGKILYVKLIADTALGMDVPHYYLEKECTNEITEMDLDILFDDAGFMDYLVVTTNGNKTYTPISAEDYRWDDNGNLEIRVDGKFRQAQMNEAVWYLLKRGENDYTSDIPIIGYRLVGLNKTYTYQVDGKPLTGYEYFIQDEHGDWYGYRMVEIVKKETENILTQNTIQTEHSKDGQYNIKDVTTVGDVQLNASASGDNKTVVIIEGSVLSSGEETVGFNGTGHTELQFANGGKFGGENASVTIQAESVTTTASGERSDIIGKTVTVSTVNGFGTEAHPIAVTVGNLGGGFNTGNTNSGSVYAETYSDFYAANVTVPADKVIFLILHGNNLYGLNAEHRLTAGTLVVKGSNNIGTSGAKLQTAVGNGGFDLTAAGNIYLNQTGGAAIQKISAGGTLVFTATGTIANAATTSLITAKDIVLESGNAIGSQTMALNIAQLTGGSLKAKAIGDIWLKHTGNDLNIIEILSMDGKVSVVTDGSILNGAESGNAAITGTEVVLDAGGNIGTESKPLTIDTERIRAEAEDKIYLDAGENEIVAYLKALYVYLTAQTVSGHVETAGLDVVSEGDINLGTVAMNGKLTVHGLKSNTGGITILAAGATEIVNAQADTTAEITVQTGDLTIQKIAAKNKVVVAAEDGNVYATGDAEAYIVTDVLEMEASGAIGKTDKFMIVKAYSDTGMLTLTASAGTGVYVQDISEKLNVLTVKSEEGNVYLKAEGELLNGLLEDAEEANVTGKNILLEAESAGTFEKPFTTNLIVDNTLEADENALIIRTKNDLTVHDIGTEGILPITEMSSEEGSVDFKAERATDINILKAEKGSITLRIDGDFTMGDLQAGKVVNIYATGSISGNVTGDFQIGNLVAGTDEEAKNITITITDGSLINGLLDDADSPVNLKGQIISINTAVTPVLEGVTPPTAGIGQSYKLIVTQVAEGGKLDISSVDTIYITDINTPDTNSELNIGTMVSQNGNIILVTGTDTSAESVMAENGEVTMTIGGVITVDIIETGKITLKADGAIDMTSDGDMVLDEISSEEGTTMITNLTSNNGNILLTTARDTSIETLSATEIIDMTVAGDVTVDALILSDEKHKLIVKADGDTDITANQDKLYVEDIEAGGSAGVHNAGELLINRLDAPMADLSSVGDLTITLVDTDATDMTVHTESGVIDILAKGDLTMTETNDSEGITNIKHLESQNGAISLLTSRDTNIDKIIAPDALQIVTAGKLNIPNVKVLGRADIEADSIDAVFEGDVNVGLIKADDINMTIYEGSLLNALADESANIIAKNANVNIYAVKPGEILDDQIIAGIGNENAPIRTQMQAGGKLNVFADHSIYLTDINTKETLETPLEIEKMTSGSGDVVLGAGTDTHIGTLLAEQGKVTMSIGGANTVDDIETGKITLNAEGAIDMTSEVDIILDEINNSEGTTMITNLTSKTGNILLTTARNTAIKKLSAVQSIDMTTVGDVTVDKLSLSDENHSLKVKASGDADITADQAELYVDDITAGGTAGLHNTGKLTINRLAAPKADLSTVGNLTINQVDAKTTSIVLDVLKGIVQMNAKGNLILTSTRSLVLENIMTGGNLDVTTDENLTLTAVVKGMLSMSGKNITAELDGNVKLGKITASKLKLTVNKGHLTNGLPDGEPNITADEADIILAEDAGFDAEKDALHAVGTEMNSIVTQMSENGKLSVLAKGDINIKDIGTEGEFVLPVLTSENGKAVLGAKRSVRILKFTAKALAANIENGTLSLNTTDDLKLDLTGEDNRLGNLKVDGEADISSDADITMDGIIEAKATSFSRMRNLRIRMMASMGDVTINSLADGGTKVILRTSEADETLSFLTNKLEVTRGEEKLNVLFNNTPGNLTVENPGGNNVYQLYTLHAPTDIVGGHGNDVYYIGMLTEENHPEALYRVRWDNEERWMSAGNLNQLSITDPDGENTFNIQHIMGKVNISGGKTANTYVRAHYYIWDEEQQAFVYYTPSLEDIKIVGGTGSNVYIGFPVYYNAEGSGSMSGNGVATGDNMPVNLMILVMGLSIFGMAFSLKGRKNR